MIALVHASLLSRQLTLSNTRSVVTSVAPVHTRMTAWVVREEALMATFSPLLRSTDDANGFDIIIDARARVFVFTSIGKPPADAPLPCEAGRPDIARLYH